MTLELHIVALGIDATDADLIEQMRLMEEKRTEGYRHVGCTISGFGSDKRELWQIPEVVAFCKRLTRIGFMAGLDVSYTFPKDIPLSTPIKPMGSLDLWLIAQGMARALIVLTEEKWNQFLKELEYQNSVCEDFLSQKGE